MPFLTIFPFSSQWTKLKIKIYIFNNFLFSDVEMKFENCQFEVVFLCPIGFESRIVERYTDHVVRHIVRLR